MKVSIIGLGWFGFPLAKRLHGDFEVVGSKRIETRQRKEGIEIFPLEFSPQPISNYLNELLAVDVLVLNIPPSGIKGSYLQAMTELIEEMRIARTGNLIFISSTGVFGNHQEVVDEKSIPQPDSVNGNLLREVEDYLLKHWEACLIVRPGGLVGGERHPAKFLAGRSGIKGQHHPVNLVHRGDLIEMTRALVNAPIEGRIFHAVAPQHPSKAAFYQEVAKKNGLPVPAFDPTDRSTGKKVLSQNSWDYCKINPVYANPYEMPLSD